MLAYNLGYLTGAVVDFWNRKRSIQRINLEKKTN